MQCRRIERVQSQLPRPQTSPALPGHNPLAAESDDVRKIASSQSSSSLSFTADVREKGRSLSNSSAISNCEPHDFIRLRASATVGPESREADSCPSFLEKRDRREWSFSIEKAHSARRFSPQGHRVRAPCPNKRRKDCVCHRVSNNEHTDPHTILNALLVLAMIERKLYSYQNARFKQNSQWRWRREWRILPVPLISGSRR